jgi:hypothetical protein
MLEGADFYKVQDRTGGHGGALQGSVQDELK